MDLSIIIVNWNTWELTLDCIKSIYNKTSDLIFEIIIVDNDSSDDSVLKIRSEFPKVIIIENDINMGFAVANNQGIQIAEGKFVLLLNSDTELLDKAVLEKSVGVMKSDESIGALGTRLLNPNKTLQPSCFNHVTVTRVIARKLLPSFIRKCLPEYFELDLSWDHNSERETDYLKGAYLMCRRDVINEIGGIDESFFMYAEEADLCFMIKKMGYRVLYKPVGNVIHYGGQSAKKVYMKTKARRIVSRYKFMLKNYGIWHAKAYQTLTVLSEIFEIIFTLKPRDKWILFYLLRMRYAY